MVRPGGAVVYATCTLSTYENADVVGSVLDSCPGKAELEDLWEELATPFSDYFTFIQPQQQQQRRGCGLLVVPTPGRTWGPMYLCRLRRQC